jgi:hypothetical protein
MVPKLKKNKITTIFEPNQQILQIDKNALQKYIF